MPGTSGNLVRLDELEGLQNDRSIFRDWRRQLC